MPHSGDRAREQHSAPPPKQFHEWLIKQLRMDADYVIGYSESRRMIELGNLVVW